jgi:hypothetical protein
MSKFMNHITAELLGRKRSWRGGRGFRGMVRQEEDADKQGVWYRINVQWHYHVLISNLIANDTGRLRDVLAHQTEMAKHALRDAMYGDIVPLLGEAMDAVCLGDEGRTMECLRKIEKVCFGTEYPDV